MSIQRERRPRGAQAFPEPAVVLGCSAEVVKQVVEKVVVAMSGGVDSSVAALLLQQQGYDVVGVTMKLYSLDHVDLPDNYQGCCTVDDVEDARAVCRRLGIPHYVLNVQREFQTFVIDYFVAEYQKGRTPHPCIACNDKIKFNFLMTRAAALNADYVATGHYAIRECSPRGWVLKKAVDQGWASPIVDSTNPGSRSSACRWCSIDASRSPCNCDRLPSIAYALASFGCTDAYFSSAVLAASMSPYSSRRLPSAIHEFGS